MPQTSRSRSARETGAYVSHRLAVAGLLGTTPFPPRLTRLIHKITSGVPRRINLLCDRALLGAYALGVRQVDGKILRAAAAEVFGAEAGARPYRPYAIAGVLALVAGGALLASGWNWRDAAGLAQAPVAVTAPAAPPAPMPARTVEAATAPAPAQSAGPAPPAEAAPAAGDASVTAALGLEPVVRATALSDPASLIDSAPTEERAQLGGLARLWQVTLGEGEPCKAALAAGLHCFQSAGGLAELRQLGRPAIIAVKDDAGVQRHVMLVALGTAGAGLQIGDQVRIVSLVALGRRMPGRFLTLWRAPPDFRSPLKPGDRGADVDWVAARLSTINNYAAPQPGRQYDAALAREVRLFQAAQGLPADGIVGPKTMMALNGAAGVPEPQLAEPQLGAQEK